MSSLLTTLKKHYREILSDRTQEKTIVRFLKNVGADSNWKIAEVGCGFGNNLLAIREGGFTPVGIEINEGIAQAVRDKGFDCYHPDADELTDVKWDALLMSHIIEHFDYKSLHEMMNSYLDNLKPGGYLIIATPLLNVRFYDNFDHVKPYTPMAIKEVFGQRGQQVQFQSHNELELDDLWLRRRPYCLQLFPSLIRKEMSLAKILLSLLNVFFVIAHYATFKLAGTTDGWVGIYRKVE